MEDKRVNIGNLNWIGDEDLFCDTLFSFCTFERDNANERKLTQTSYWTPCRETLINYVRDCFTWKKHSVDRNTMRLLILFKNKARPTKRTTEKNVSRGLKIINFFEGEMGWSKSKLFKVESENIPIDCFIYLFHGPKQWMANPYIISLYTLFVRMGKYNVFDNFSTYKQFIKMSDKLVNETINNMVDNRNGRSPNDWPDAGPNTIDQLDSVINIVIPFLKNLRSLFKGRTRRDIFISAATNDGITNLCQNVIRDKGLKINFTDLRKKVNIERKSDSIYTRARTIRIEREKERRVVYIKRWSR